jgi:cell wall-associated NlpC family hydrolase
VVSATRTRRLVTRLAVIAAIPAVGLGSVVVASTAASASGATAHNPVGAAERITRTATAFTVSGWAADPDAKGRPVTIQVTVDSHVAARFRADGARFVIAHDHHTGPNPGFSATVPVSATTHTICLTAANIGPGTSTALGCAQLNTAGAVVKAAPDRGAQIAALAKTFVGGRYVDGGSTPAGFDCSGLTQWVYKHAVNINLPHNAQAQSNGARKITAAQARPGDLVFFHSASGAIYHVGIFAAPHMMWAAATPQDGIRYQSIWSNAVTYGTYTH